MLYGYDCSIRVTAVLEYIVYIEDVVANVCLSELNVREHDCIQRYDHHVL